MNPEELLSELSQRGVILSAVDDKLRIDAPKGMLTVELRQLLVEYKQLILNLLSPPAPIVAAPTVQEPDQTGVSFNADDNREKELDELIDQLKPLNRHWKIEWAREKKVPMKALLHASHLWLSDDTNDWSAANNTIFQFTSPWGNKQLCYPCSEKVAIPELSIKK